MSNKTPEKPNQSSTPDTGRKAGPLAIQNERKGPRTFAQLKEMLSQFKKDLVKAPGEYIGISFCAKTISPDSLKILFKENMFFYNSVLAEAKATKAADDGSFVECFCYIPEITGMLPWPDYKTIKYAFSDTDIVSEWNALVEKDNKLRSTKRKREETIKKKNAELNRVDQQARKLRASKGIPPDSGPSDTIKMDPLMVEGGFPDVSKPLKYASKKEDLVTNEQIEEEINKITMYPRFYKYTADAPPPIFQPVKVKFVSGMPSKFAGILVQSTGDPWIPPDLIG